MTTQARAEQLATSIIAGALQHDDPESVCATADEHLDRWITEDEETAMESIIVAYSILGDVIEHINARIGAPHGL